MGHHDSALNSEKEESKNTQPGYKCLRNQEDGSMYYGEVAYLRKSNGQLIKVGMPAYEAEIKTLEAEARIEQFEMVRHGHGLQLYNGQRNDDGVMTKYEGAWQRNRKHGQGSAVFADGSTYTGRFNRDVMDGQGQFTWP